MMTRRRDIFPTRGGYDGHKFLYLSQLSEQVAAQESNTFMVLTSFDILGVARGDAECAVRG